MDEGPFYVRPSPVTSRDSFGPYLAPSLQPPLYVPVGTRTYLRRVRTVWDLLGFLRPGHIHTQTLDRPRPRTQRETDLTPFRSCPSPYNQGPGSVRDSRLSLRHSSRNSTFVFTWSSEGRPTRNKDPDFEDVTVSFTGTRTTEVTQSNLLNGPPEPPVPLYFPSQPSTPL